MADSRIYAVTAFEPKIGSLTLDNWIFNIRLTCEQWYYMRYICKAYAFFGMETASIEEIEHLALLLCSLSPAKPGRINWSS